MSQNSSRGGARIVIEGEADVFSFPDQQTGEQVSMIRVTYFGGATNVPGSDVLDPKVIQKGDWITIEGEARPQKGGGFKIGNAFARRLVREGREVKLS